jgi:hypothetical protein
VAGREQYHAAEDRPDVHRVRLRVWVDPQFPTMRININIIIRSLDAFFKI